MPSVAVDVASAELTPLGSWPPGGGALEGDPQASGVELHVDDRVEYGIWECTPGVYASSRSGYSEQFTIISGEASIVDDDGTRHELRPGVVMVLPDGWSGTWEIRQTIRKTYATVTTG